jgi:hypothetical protein
VLRQSGRRRHQRAHGQRTLESLSGLSDMAGQDDVRSARACAERSHLVQYLVHGQQGNRRDGLVVITEAMVISRSTVESSGNGFAGPSVDSEERKETRGPFDAPMRREATDAVSMAEAKDWSTETPPSAGGVSWRG